MPEFESFIPCSPSDLAQLPEQPFGTISDLIRYHARQQPQHAALIQGERTLNYAALDALIDAFQSDDPTVVGYAVPTLALRAMHPGLLRRRLESAYGPALPVLAAGLRASGASVPSDTRACPGWRRCRTCCFDARDRRKIRSGAALA